ncbi:hypothetical protein ACNKHS_13845 [Shigella flexneri]
MLSIAWRRNHFLNATLSVLVSTLRWSPSGLLGRREHGRHAADARRRLRDAYTGLVLLASLATCTFAYPWLEGYNDNKKDSTCRY